MANTKKEILTAALRLFAMKGYEAVSVSQIAGELGITKGALYRHYKNKRDIFDSIFEYVCSLDAERAKGTKVPEKEFSAMPDSFKGISAESLKEYMVSQFRYWSQDEIACNFRRMVTLEQYKTAEMNELCQKVLTNGPLDYIEHLFQEMMKDREHSLKLLSPSPRQMAVEFYAPFYLLLSVSDTTDKEEEKKRIADEYERWIEDFFQRYSLEKGKQNEMEE